MMSKLEEQVMHWVALGALRALDLALMRFIQEQYPEASEPLLLSTALVSEANGRGHVCLDLQSLLEKPAQQLSVEPCGSAEVGDPAQELAEWLQGWTLTRWVKALLETPVVSDERDQPAPRTGSTPLVLGGSATQPLLYLRRYWFYERQIQAYLDYQLAQPYTLPPSQIRPLLDALFPDLPPTEMDDQKVACALASRSSFAIITGGPGTGKTTTVVRLLALLQGLQQLANRPLLNIKLAAPTGKAAARLSESLAQSVSRIHLPARLESCRASIPTEVATLHRLLGSQAGTRHFRHHVGHPLPADLVIVDEASMVDVEMLARLMEALTPQTRLILLGDKDQLASVEAGSVLGDLCRSADAGDYTPATRDWLFEASGQTLPAKLIDEQGSRLAQATALLRHSYRFSASPGIGALAQAVNSGQATVEQIKAVFAHYHRQQRQPITAQHSLTLIQLQASWPAATRDLDPLKKLLRQGYKGYLDVVRQAQPAVGLSGAAEREALDIWAHKVFQAHRQFQLLTAVRRGPWGVEALNELALASLKDLLPEAMGAWYSGRPVLVTRNDYSLKLMNGDIGICLEWPQAAQDRRHRLLRVAFPDGQGGIRWILPSRLQGIETVFAMTVHKSQGSEFTHTALVLPDRPSPVLTQELLYTGITRSSSALTLIYSDDSVLQATLRHQIKRASGLAGCSAPRS